MTPTSTREYTFTRGELVSMDFAQNCGEDTPDSEKCYLFKFYDETDQIIFTKIGTTAKTCKIRLKQEIAYYRKRDIDIVRVEISKIIQCGEMPAESYESYLRALLMKKYPNTWHKNDRFFGIDIPTETFEELCDFFRNI